VHDNRNGGKKSKFNNCRQSAEVFDIPMVIVVRARRPDNYNSSRQPAAASRERTQNVTTPLVAIIMYILYYIHTYWISGLYIHCILNIISNLSTINTPTRLSDPTIGSDGGR